MRKHVIAIFLLHLLLNATSLDAAPFCASYDEATGDTVAIDLQELTVSSNRAAESLKSTAPTHRIDARQILETGITDISEALRRLPGVNLRDYGGSGGMKTVSVRGLGTQHTNVVYDGASLSDIQGGQIDLSRYSLDNMNSITLNVGDADDIYMPARSVSASNTLNIGTLKNPDLMSRRPDLTLRMRIASFLTLNPYLRMALSNGSDLGMSVTGEFTHAGNNYPFTLVNGDYKSRERRQNSQLNLGHAEWNGIWKPRPWSRLQAKAYWFTSSRHLPGPVTYYNETSHQRLGEFTAFGQLAYDSRLSNIFSLKTLAKFNWSSTRYKDVSGIYPGGKLDQKYSQREQYLTATLLARITPGLQLSYAADFWHNSLNSNLKTDNHPIRNSLLQAIAAKWQIWRLTATARGLLSIIHDNSDSAEGGKTEKRLSPSVGISVQPLENAQWSLRASYKDIFRMPTFNELYFDHYGSINLKPETARQLNLGTTWQKRVCNWFPDLQLTFDGYWNRVTNKIVAMPYNMFVMTMTNLGKVRILGLDATLAADFRLAERHNLAVTGNYSYQRAAPRTDRSMNDWMKQVAYTPLNSGAFSLTWKNPWVNAVFTGSGCSSKYSTNANIASTRIAGYLEFGVTLYRELKLGRTILELRGDISNLFDRQYEIIARYPMPGRSFSFSAAFRM